MDGWENGWVSGWMCGLMDKQTDRWIVKTKT